MMSALSNQGTFESAYSFLGAFRGKDQSSKTSLLTLLTSDLTPHIAYLAPHTSHFHLTPHSSHLTPHISRLILHTSHLTPHSSNHTPRASDLQTSHLKPQMSHLTHHNPHLTPHASHLSSRISDLIHPLSDREFSSRRVAWCRCYLTLVCCRKDCLYGESPNMNSPISCFSSSIATQCVRFIAGRCPANLSISNVACLVQY